MYYRYYVACWVKKNISKFFSARAPAILLSVSRYTSNECYLIKYKGTLFWEGYTCINGHVNQLLRLVIFLHMWREDPSITYTITILDENQTKINNQDKTMRMRTARAIRLYIYEKRLKSLKVIEYESCTIKLEVFNVGEGYKSRCNINYITFKRAFVK